MAEVKKEETKESSEVKEKAIKVPDKFKDLVAEIEKMSVLELSELVKVLEEKFGVSASAPVMAAPVQAGGGLEGGAGEQEKTDYNIELISAGDSKIAIIKLVNEITGQGLKGAKDLVDGVPKVIKEKVKKEEAEEIKKKLEEAGATVELK